MHATPTLLLATLLTLPACTAPPTSTTPPRPNILILLTDDQQADAIAALGNEHIATPHMDTLVRDGLAFTNAYVMGARHGAVCMPSRAMLLTGRHLFSLPQSVTETWSVPPAERGVCPDPTFPELLRDAGYETCFTGKWHNGRRLFARGFTAGDAIFFGGMSDHDRVPAHAFDPSGVYPGATANRDRGFSSTIFAQAAVEYLQDREPRDDPFLLYVSFTAPHDPRTPPPPYDAQYDPDQLPLPPSFLPEHPFPIGDLKIRDEKLASWPRTPAVVRAHLAAYYGMISHLDAQIGRILAALDAAGERDDTIVILASDNGLAVGRHGLLGKQSVYEHSSRVPLVIAGPGIPRGETSNALVYLHDVMPTICDLTGIPTPAGVEARSLAPIIRGERRAVRDTLLLAYDTDAEVKRPVGDEGRGIAMTERTTATMTSIPRGSLRALRVGRWKLIRTRFDDHRHTLLFDLDADPHETTNLAANPTPDHAARIERMTTGLHAAMHATGDDLPPADRP